MKYICRFGHIANDPDYCRQCLADNYGVKPSEEPVLMASFNPVEPESKPEELTPVLERVDEGAPLPVSKAFPRKR